MPQILTVRGPVDVSTLGPTLAHEHVAIVSPEFAALYPEMSWGGDRADVVKSTVAKLQAVRDRGIETILDCTAYFHGRDVEFTKEVNDQVDINVIMSTGIYTYDYLPQHILYRQPTSPADDIMTRMFIRDITVGIGDSGVKAQSIKVATDVQGFTDNNVRILRAAAKASTETGAPITAHTHPADRQAGRLLEILGEDGVDLSTVVVGHSGDTDDLGYLRGLMDAGAIMGDDRFGLTIPNAPDEQGRIEILATLCQEGYSGRIVLGHDSLMHCDWFDAPLSSSMDTWVPTRVSDVIIPALRDRGVPEDDIQAMLVSVPASLFKNIAA